MAPADQRDSSNLKNILSTIAIFTAIPADLLAILPAIYRLLIQMNFLPGEPTPLPTEINIGFNLPIRDIVLGLIFYSFAAFVYWIVNKSNAHFVRDISFGFALLFLFPLVLALTTFNLLSLADGSAIAVLCLTTAYYYRTRISDSNSSYRYDSIMRTWAEYKDVGILYFLWVVLVWMFLQIDQDAGAWTNFKWALLYCGIGYVVSLIVVSIVGQIWILVGGSYSRYKFEVDINTMSAMTLFITLLSLYVTLGLFFFSSWIAIALWIGIPIIVIAVLWWMNK